MAPCRWADKSFPTRPRGRFFLLRRHRFPVPELTRTPCSRASLYRAGTQWTITELRQWSGCSAVQKRRRTPTSGRESGGPLPGIFRVSAPPSWRSRPRPEARSRREAVEADIPGAILEKRGGRTQLAQGRLRQGAAEQADLELVERIERHPATLDRMLSALGRVLEPLERDQRVDAADGAQTRPAQRPSARSCLAEREGALRRPPDRRRGGGGRRPLGPEMRIRGRPLARARRVLRARSPSLAMVNRR